DIRQRYELVLADRNHRGGYEDPRRIDLVQVDGLGQTQKGLRTMARRVIATPREQIALHREDVAILLPPRGAREARAEFLRAAVGGHRQSPRELQSFALAAARKRETHHLPLHTPPGGSHRVGSIGRADREQMPHSLRVALPESQ